MKSDQFLVSHQHQTKSLAEQLANVINHGDVLFLKGDLGAGKTFFAKSFIFQLGYKDTVNSPTFSIVESYTISSTELNDEISLKNAMLGKKSSTPASMTIHHFDLYRIESYDELESIGFRDYFNGTDIVIIEWPEKTFGFRIKPSFDINIGYDATRDYSKASGNVQKSQNRTQVRKIILTQNIQSPFEFNKV